MDEIRPVIQAFVEDELMTELPNVVMRPDVNLIEEGVVDSLGIFLLIDLIENHFDVSVEPEDVVLANFETIDAMVRMVASKQAARV